MGIPLFYFFKFEGNQTTILPNALVVPPKQKTWLSLNEIRTIKENRTRAIKNTQRFIVNSFR